MCREFPVQCTNKCGLRDIPRKKASCFKASLENTRSLNGILQASTIWSIQSQIQKDLQEGDPRSVKRAKISGPLGVAFFQSKSGLLFSDAPLISPLLSHG